VVSSSHWGFWWMIFCVLMMSLLRPFSHAYFPPEPLFVFFFPPFLILWSSLTVFLSDIFSFFIPFSLLHLPPPPLALLPGRRETCLQISSFRQSFFFPYFSFEQIGRRSFSSQMLFFSGEQGGIISFPVSSLSFFLLIKQLLA